MAVLTVQRKMLYCPKCNRTYEEGTQRFCSTDGSRLLPTPSPGKAQTKGVFTTLLNRTLKRDENDKKNASRPRLVKPVEKQPPPPAPEIILDLLEKEDFQAVTENQSPTEEGAKPIPRLIKASEVPPSQAKLGDRSQNPTGRLALTWENTAILLGQTIKGRYHIIEQLSVDETSVGYLAEDKIIEGKKVIVRVLMDEKEANDYSSKIFAEERVSLSHINHPNVAHLLDSGELLEGKSFIVSEYVAGASLREKLRQTGAFNPLRTARIIRQAASALSEAHENGVMHRSLKPQHIILSVSDAGIEQVKVTDFAVFDGFDKPNEETIKYLSPEQLEGRLPNYASDIYSLAVVAYQMLTGRLPFNFSTEKDLLKAQKEGLTLRPTNLRLDLSPQVDEILERALAYKPSERYPKARDFGDAFFNALTAVASWEKPPFETYPAEEKFPFVVKEPVVLPAEKGKSAPPSSPAEPEPPAKALEEIHLPKIREVFKKEIPQKETPQKELLKKGTPKKEIPKIEDEREIKGKFKTEVKPVKAAEDLSPGKRSPEPTSPAVAANAAAAKAKAATTPRVFLLALGLLLLGVGAWVIWNQFSNRSAAPVFSPPQNDTKTAGAETENSNAPLPVQKIAPPTNGEIQSPPPPPLPRKIQQPPNTEYFQNSKENLKGDLAKNFRGFSFYYPNDWTKNPSPTNFVDVARIGATGTPIEQILVTYYESRGTFAADAEKFPKLVEQSNENLKKALNGKYTLLSHGETKINGSWRAYEMKFQAEGITKNGDRIMLWGRRLWIPAARPGSGSGFVITMIATSLSPEVKSADDVGVKGELASVLETFEPTPSDAAH